MMRVARSSVQDWFELTNNKNEKIINFMSKDRKKIILSSAVNSIPLIDKFRPIISVW